MPQLDPPSPCTKVCVIDQQRGLCRGCHRTLNEIAEWASASAPRKQAILAELAMRQSVSVTSI